jgi:hypothetical protein
MAKKKPNERGIRVQGKKLRQMRKLRGYSSAADLAVEPPPQNPKTIEKAERGEPVDPDAFTIICEKLDLNPLTLDPNPVPTPQLLPHPEQHQLIGLDLYLNGPKELIDLIKRHPQAAQLFNLLVTYDYIKHEYLRPRLRFSSVIFSAHLCPSDVLRIMNAFLANRLDWIGIQRIDVMSGDIPIVSLPDTDPIMFQLFTALLADETRGRALLETYLESMSKRDAARSP